MRARVEEKRTGFLTQHVRPRSVPHRLRGSAAAARCQDGPTSEAAGQFLNVLLGVVADAETGERPDQHAGEHRDGESGAVDTPSRPQFLVR